MSIIINNNCANSQYKHSNTWNYTTNPVNIPVPSHPSTSKDLLIEYLISLDFNSKLHFLHGAKSFNARIHTVITHLIQNSSTVPFFHRLAIDDAITALVRSTPSSTASLHSLINLFPAQAPQVPRSIFSSIPRGAGPEAAWVFGGLNQASQLTGQQRVSRASGKAKVLYDNGCTSSSTSTTSLNNLIDVLPTFIQLSTHLMTDIPQRYTASYESLQKRLHSQAISFSAYHSLLDDLNSKYIINDNASRKDSLPHKSSSSFTKSSAQPAHPSTHWYNLLADLITMSVIQGYKQRGWRGSRAVEVLLSLTTTTHMMFNDSKEALEDSSSTSLPSLSTSLRALFTDKSTEQAMEFDNILADRLTDFLSVPDTCTDLTQHLNMLERKYYSEHFDTTLVQFLADVNEWLGVATLRQSSVAEQEKKQECEEGEAQLEPRHKHHEPLPSPQLSHPANPLSIAALLGPSDDVVLDDEHSKHPKHPKHSKHSKYSPHTDMQSKSASPLHTRAHGSAKWFVLTRNAPAGGTGSRSRSYANAHHDLVDLHTHKRARPSLTPTLPSFTTNAFQTENAGAFSWPGPYGV
ncbi:hypothetical protein E3P99_02118 [Wallemia hederae]|uniref:Uncharacterized protein n=1 Tax=Wallemia hederae TaxID=1540922 RepID=A0A4T0FNF3_9BASI|nr:hypothetical protein E3P99_02118 [Wallemia hederae]